VTLAMGKDVTGQSFAALLHPRHRRHEGSADVAGDRRPRYLSRAYSNAPLSLATWVGQVEVCSGDDLTSINPWQSSDATLEHDMALHL